MSYLGKENEVPTRSYVEESLDLSNGGGKIESDVVVVVITKSRELLEDEVDELRFVHNEMISDGNGTKYEGERGVAVADDNDVSADIDAISEGNEIKREHDRMRCTGRKSEILCLETEDVLQIVQREM